MTAETLIESNILERIENSLDKIRPYLEIDGGNVKVLEVTNKMILRLELLGACGTCPMSLTTMKGGIEEVIMRDLPEIKGIEAINITTADSSKAKLPT